ncbi:MAG: hypothetical protein SFY32_07165 [Bacteroidota bacterium]|nr:hypothetical protein [Bacteroidota bacterium]
MKKIILSTLFIGFSIISNAQVSKGTLAIGGQIGLSFESSKNKSTFGAVTTETDGPAITKFSILPAVQYFVIDKFSIGINVGYQLSSSYQKSTSTFGGTSFEVTNSSGAFVVAPFARYYYMLSENFGFFGQAAVPLMFGTNTTISKSGSTSVTTDLPYSSFGFQLTPGIVFFPTKKIGIEATLGNIFAIQAQTVATSKNPDASYTKTNIDLFNVNTFGFNMGFFYYFAK